MGLGVRLWVVDVGFSQCGAIPYGVTIGVAAFLRIFFRKSKLDSFPAQMGVDESESYPFFLCPYPAGATSKITAE